MFVRTLSAIALATINVVALSAHTTAAASIAAAIQPDVPPPRMTIFLIEFMSAPLASTPNP